MTAVTVAICCGIPGYLIWPMWGQSGVTGIPPVAVADLTLRQDDAAATVRDQLRAEMQREYPMADDTFAALYADGYGKRVTVAGATGFSLQPGTDVDAEISRLTNYYKLRNVAPQESGTRGVHLRCGTGRADGVGVVVCGWADHGSVGAGVFTRRSVEDSATLLSRLREAILQPN